MKQIVSFELQLNSPPMKKLLYILFISFVFTANAQENLSYQKPPEEILDLVDVERAQLERDRHGEKYPGKNCSAAGIIDLQKIWSSGQACILSMVH